MKNTEIKSFSKLIFLINVIILFVCLIVLLIIRKYTWVLGYLLGSVTSYITYIMHAHNVNKMGVSIKNPIKNSVTSALFRLFICALSLLIALFVSWIDLYTTFVGLVVIKLTVVVTSMVIEIKNNHKIKGGNVET